VLPPDHLDQCGDDADVGRRAAAGADHVEHEQRHGVSIPSPLVGWAARRSVSRASASPW
jgi:hypothetical protein